MRPRRRCAVIAHRGGAREVPENTWSAVEHVESLGLTWMETDLHATADDVVVLSHDADLGRIGGRGTLSELTWDEAAGARCRRWPRPRAVGRGSGGPSGDSHSTWISRSPRSCSRLCRWSGPPTPSTGCGSPPSPHAVWRCWRRQEPRATTSLGGFDIAGLMLLSEAALPLPHTRWGWTRGRVDAVQVPPMHRGMQVVTRRFVAQAHTAGLEVHVWTIDDPEEMRRLAALNVDAIMTDVPTLALEILGS